MLSPFNVAMDLLTLPHNNKKIYSMEDLPDEYQSEINEVINASEEGMFIGDLGDQMGDTQRGMIFYQWYGSRMEISNADPTFNKKFRFIKTIGISVFNKKVATSKHFGPLRATLRVLYSINDIQSKESYIDVGGIKNHWSENKLFIFDDTLMHQSVNQTDDLRYCLFIDILRPSRCSWLMNNIVRILGISLGGVNRLFYKNWSPLRMS